MASDVIGASIRRKEDVRFLVGEGRYTDDIVFPRQSFAQIVRSPHAHARIRNIDTSAAKALPGVLAVFTGADIAAAGLGGLPCGWGVTDRHGKAMAEPAHPLLVQDKVRQVGDNVAMVVAETRVQARDAAEAIRVDYEPLPCVTSAIEALGEGAPLVHDSAPDNLCYDWEIGAGAAVDQALARAQGRPGGSGQQPGIPNAIEPRAACAVYDAPSDSLTLYMTSQNPHVIRLLMGAFVLQIPEQKLRVVAPDVGGGFGSKIYHYAEEALVSWAAKQVRRPVKWTSGRDEAFMTDAHARDHVTRAELALGETADSWRSRSTRPPTWARISRRSRTRSRPISTR
jgi:carbon-monoxide dehydrogenase large subunit